MDNPLKTIEQEIEQAVDKVEDIVGNIVHKKPWYKKVHFWLIIIFFIIIIIAGLLYYSYWSPIKSSIALARQTQAQFEKVQTDLLSADFDQAKKNIQVAQLLLERLENNVDKLDSPLMIGYLKRQYDAVEKIITATKEFSDGLYLLTDLTQEVLSHVETKDGNLTVSPTAREIILEKFSQKTPDLNGAKAQIDLSLLALNEISASKLNPTLADYVSTLRTKMSLLRNFLDKAVSLSQSFPELLGLNSEKTYLFLLQNNNELRPTGGFIGTIGILKIKNGQITLFTTQNIYDYDKYAHGRLHVSPPEPIKKYLNVDAWYMRDSNWSADFKQAAKQIEWFYHEEANLSNGNLRNYGIDGVFAITPKIVQEFLGIVGAIEVDSFVFNKDNFVDQLQYLVEVGYEEQGVPYWQRKDIVGNLSQKIITRTENLNLEGWVELIKIIFNNLSQKHILIYSKNTAVQNIIEDQDWSGVINSTENDYLMVIDANLASLKSNQCIKRDIKYTLKPVAGDMIARVDINYQNDCTFTWKSTRYRTYTRAYVPLGSELIRTIGSMEIDRSSREGQTDISEENDKTVLGAFISIEPQEKGTLVFEYKLPDHLSDKLQNGEEYNLYVQKQPGTLNDKLNINLTMPEKLKTSNPGESRQYWGDNKYQVNWDLEEDREVKIGF